jgi:hypothetical protein
MRRCDAGQAGVLRRAVGDPRIQIWDEIERGLGRRERSPQSLSDRSSINDAILEMLNAHSGPMTLRAVSDIVGATQRRYNRSAGRAVSSVERLRNRV